MLLYSLDEWSAAPPHLLVAGDGPFAVALGQVLSGTMISLNALDERAQEDEVAGGESYHLLEELHSIMMIVPLNAGFTDVARWVDQVWGMVERFSSAKDQHDLRWLFVPVANDHVRLEEGLRAVLAMQTGAQLTTHGYGVWCPQRSLEALVGGWQTIDPTDLFTLRARRNRDGRWRALRALLDAVQGENPEAVVAVANEVATHFFKHEYLLDVFCRPPSHQHGNKFRHWLAEIVTHGVTPHLDINSRSAVEGWLLQELASPPLTPHPP